jgi:hypothetical protein
LGDIESLLFLQLIRDKRIRISAKSNRQALPGHWHTDCSFFQDSPLALSVMGVEANMLH